MPAKSQQQLKLIYAKRGQYKTKSKTPEKWQWIWDEEWTDVKFNKLPEKIQETNGVSLNQELRDSYIEEILNSTMDDRKDLEKMSDDNLEERYYEVLDFLHSHPIDPSAGMEEWIPEDDTNEKLITKFDKFINESGHNHRGPLPVAHKINGKWEIESFDGLSEVAKDYHPFEILSVKRDPEYGYDHVVMLFVKFTKGIPKKHQTPENTYGLCIWDMDNKVFIEELGTLEDYDMTVDNLEKKTGFSIPEND